MDTYDLIVSTDPVLCPSTGERSGASKKGSTTYARGCQRVPTLALLTLPMISGFAISAGSWPARERPYKAEVGGSKPPAPTTALVQVSCFSA